MTKENKIQIENFQLECGEVLPQAEFSFRTYGSDTLPAVLVSHALTGNSNAGDWWGGIIGEGKIIDPSKYFIICANFLGSCYGSTGPESVHPQTGKPYHADFPIITIKDIARQHLSILD